MNALPTLMMCLLMGVLAAPEAEGGADTSDGYTDLLRLFEDWRNFERPPMIDGVPDYTEPTNQRRQLELKHYQARLRSIDFRGWPVTRQIDWRLVEAEMNGMDFNFRVLRPWARDPAFYTSIWTEQSDTPAHEGPAHHAIIDLWTYTFPLDAASEARLKTALRTIPPLLAQARINLTGNARELWVAGIQNLRDQVANLDDLAGRTADQGADFQRVLQEARAATAAFVSWLDTQSAHKTGPSGIGKDNYTWQLQHVHLVPMTWEEEVNLLRGELDRALASLKVEEHRNRDLPPLRAISSPGEYAQRAEQSVIRFRDFLRDEAVLPPYPFIESQLRAHTGGFVPQDQRNFFAIVSHYEPLALWTHWYHWFDHGVMDTMPNASPIRRGPLLYNIWDNRSEGMATAFEEIALQAGLFDQEPRARELVWIMLAVRAARGLGSLYAQANIFTLKQARDFHVAWTPRGWMRDDLDLLGFEQLLYLRQPGYGSSYVTGKYLITRLMGVRGREMKDAFRLADFFARFNEAGVIPVSLIHWQMTGDDQDLRKMYSND